VRQQVFGASGGGKEGGLGQQTGGWGGEGYVGGEYDMELTLDVKKRSQTEYIHRAGGKAG